MVGELISLPLRATGLAARLWWRSAKRTLSLASDAAEYVAGIVTPSRPGDHLAHPRTDGPTFSEPPVPASSPVVSTSRTDVTDPLQPAEQSSLRVTEPQPAPPAEEPTHVSEEPELVEEFAEPGAEDGAGPELHVREPWDGYRGMNTREVTARLSDASAAELAAVQLYESSTRARQAILSAVARQMRGANGSGARA